MKTKFLSTVAIITIAFSFITITGNQLTLSAKLKDFKDDVEKE